MLLATVLLFAQLADPRVDRVYADLDRPDGPGCAVAVVRDGNVVHERGYGMANLELGVPISPQSVFYAGSVSKQFTAASIARLASEGRLSLNDPLHQWVPELPDFGPRLTIGTLVHHISGMRDYLALFSLSGLPPDGVYDTTDVFGILARQRALNFPPGERYLYSNSGYWLLGEIVARASGATSLRRYADSVFFGPLGMTSTHFIDDHTEIVPNRAQAYEPRAGGGWRISVPHFDLVGAGGLHTTIRDLERWDAMFRDTTAAVAGFVRGLHERGVLSSGDTIDYAFGLTVGHYRGLPTVSHGGAYGGFRADITRFPDAGLSVLQLCNASNANPGERALRVADALLGARFTAPRPAPAAVDGRASGRRVAVDSAAGAAYTGRYYSLELDAIFDIAYRDGRLVVLRRGRPAPLVATAERDRFIAAGVGTLTFERDDEGRVTGFAVGAGRATGIGFDRVADGG